MAEVVEGPPHSDRQPGPFDLVVRAPLWAHVSVLVVVLVLFGWYAHPGPAYTSDEGAALLQAQQLNETGSWYYEYPLDAFGLGSEARPFLRGDAGTNGLAPYAKHPVYVEVLRLADGAGPIGPAAVSLVGTALAALGAALLARQLRPSLDRAALWTVGLASPLLFDSFLVLAHTLAAATAVSATYAAVRALRSERGGRVGWLVLEAVLVAGTVVLRSEGVFLGPALAVGAAVVWWSRRDQRRGPGLIAAAALGATAVAWYLERLWVKAIVGTSTSTSTEATPTNWFEGRFRGLWATWFDTGYGPRPTTDALLGLACLSVAAAALLFRFRPERERPIEVALIASVVLYVAAFLVGDVGAVPGLAVVFPVGWAGLLLFSRPVLAVPGARLTAVTALAATVAVVLTQYARGGGLEWGGRYFAFIVPIAAPVLLVSIVESERARKVSDRLRAIGLVSAFAVSTVVALLAVSTARDVHLAVGRVSAALELAGPIAGTPDRLEHPVLVSWNPLLPQILHRDFDQFEWVSPSRRNLQASLDALAAAGVERVVYVTPDLANDADLLTGWKVVERPPIAPGATQEIVVLERESPDSPTAGS